MDEEKNIFDYLIVIAKWKRFILTFFFSVAIITVIVSLILPKYYRSESVIMPPEEEVEGFGISSLLSQLEELPIGGLGITQSTEKTKRIIAILESRSLMEKIVNRFDLIKSYKVKNMTDAIKRLRTFAKFRINESGAISISVVDKLPPKASEMANYLVNELEKMNIELNIEKARNNRIFIEERYKQNKKELTEAEEKYREFQKTYNVISLPVQTEAAIVAAANLSTDIYRIEIELGIKEKTFGKNHSEIRALESELNEYRRNLHRLFEESENPVKGGVAGDEDKLFIPFEKAPEVEIEFIRIKRELEVQNSIFEMLTTLYEQAKIEEAKDTPTIQVLDKAIPPEKKYKPRRALMVTVWSGIALVFSVVLAFLFDYMERVSSASNENSEKVNKLKGLLFKKK